jgi:hypothetical protein
MWSEVAASTLRKAADYVGFGQGHRTYEAG